jgi:hypothetical protein
MQRAQDHQLKSTHHWPHNPCFCQKVFKTNIIMHVSLYFLFINFFYYLEIFYNGRSLKSWKRKKIIEPSIMLTHSNLSST